MSCLQACRDMVKQIDELIYQIPQEDYARPLEVFNGSTLGQHFRHILNFYECIVHGNRVGQIDYARRDRDPQVEIHPDYARSSFAHILTELEKLSETDTLSVMGDFFKETEPRTAVASSIGRELMYAFDHAIHHLAIIRIGLDEIGAKEVAPKDLGVAPSTVRHRDG